MCLGIDVLVLNLLWFAEVWGDENGFYTVLVIFCKCEKIGDHLGESLWTWLSESFWVGPIIWKEPPWTLVASFYDLIPKYLMNKMEICIHLLLLSVCGCNEASYLSFLLPVLTHHVKSRLEYWTKISPFPFGCFCQVFCQSNWEK